MTGCARILSRVAWCCSLWCGLAAAQTPEFRALWVDTFHSGIKSSSQINTLLADLRAGNFNAVIPEVRKRGDAYYNSLYDPRASDMTSTNSLAELIAKAHNTNGGVARIEVHPWIVSFIVWNSQTTSPPEPNHPYNLHPDWLTQNDAGVQWDGGGYAFDPGHPEVQKYTFNVAMDIIANYDVDGFNFDYIRYSGNTWGYNPVTVARFNRRFGRSGQPAATDPDWLQFRRDQVTALVRKVYLFTMAIKPHVKISADTIVWAPGPTSDAGWTNSSAAYTAVLQDWRSWMQEGILDLNIPMTYYDQAGAYTTSWTNWNNFAKNHRFNRHLAIGPGTYLNTLSNALLQMRFTRAPSPTGNFADGQCGYSYAVPTDPAEGISRPTFLAALTSTNTSRLYETNQQPIFATRVPIPEMPWKTAPTRGHIKGFVYGGTTTNPLDGATVTVTGAVQRTTISDATGFYGFVDLPPGNYGVSSVSSLFGSARSTFVVSAGIVSTADLLLSTNDTIPPVISDVTVTQITDSSARVNWLTDKAASSMVEYGLSVSYSASVTNAALVNAHSVPLSGLAANSTYHFRVRSRDAQGNLGTSGDFMFATALPPPPTITAHPQSRTVRVGSNVVFSVSATGAGPLSYQWRFNETNLPGATSTVYVRANVTTNHAGIYSVVVSNAGGSVASSNATLTVVWPTAPAIEQIALWPGNQVQLLISGDAGYPVAVEGSQNLYNWTVLGSLMNSNGTVNFTNNPATNRYYRVRAE
jgi:uncharacterized lipoprotein YddW (UPF0748 family)